MPICVGVARAQPETDRPPDAPGRWYNPARLHLGLGIQVAPANYEADMQAIMTDN